MTTPNFKYALREVLDSSTPEECVPDALGTHSSGVLLHDHAECRTHSSRVPPHYHAECRYRALRESYS
jgi:tRNA isopentenyl-2-thiomethyl-A-37 hydroxylase MiaE